MSWILATSNTLKYKVKLASLCLEVVEYHLMVIIRLARFGRKKAPFYRVVVLDSTKKVSGKNLEVIGFWNPAKKKFKLDKDRFSHWVKIGAQISPAIKKLAIKEAK